MHLIKGWNLVSLASLPIDNSVASVFGDHVIGPVWGWGWGENGCYTTTQELLPLRGHWVYSHDDVTLEL